MIIMMGIGMYLLCGLLWMPALILNGFEDQYFKIEEHTRIEKIRIFVIGVLVWPIAVLNDLILEPIFKL